MGTTEGSKDPNNRILGPRYYNIKGIWALSPVIWVLGPLGKAFGVYQGQPPFSRYSCAL